MLTIKDIEDRLAQQPEISVLEILEITSEDLVARFGDRILERADALEEELKDESYE